MQAAGNEMGSHMAHEEEPILTKPGSPQMVHHVHVYSRFTSLLKWGAVIALIVALILVFGIIA